MDLQTLYQKVESYHHLKEWSTYLSFVNWIDESVLPEEKCIHHIVKYVNEALFGDFPYFMRETSTFFMDLHIANELHILLQTPINPTLQIVGFFRLVCKEGWYPENYGLSDEIVNSISLKSIRYIGEYFTDEKKSHRMYVKSLCDFIMSYVDYLKMCKTMDANILRLPITNLLVSSFFERDPITFKTICVIGERFTIPSPDLSESPPLPSNSPPLIFWKETEDDSYSLVDFSNSCGGGYE